MTFRQPDTIYSSKSKCVRCLRESCQAHRLWLQLPDEIRNPRGFGACGSEATARFFEEEYTRAELLEINDECMSPFNRVRS